MNPVDTLTLLNRLIVTTKNGEHTLAAAAHEVHSPELKQALYDYAQFFHQAADDLNHAMERHGGRPHARASFGNAVHRTALHLRALALGRKESTILDDIEDEEMRADELYADVDNWDLPDDVRALIVRQGAEARRRHDQIDALREQLVH